MTTEQLEAQAPVQSWRFEPTARRWLAMGTGVGVEIGRDRLQVTIARVRPNGIAVIGSATVVDFPRRPAAEWGAELLAFLRRIGVAHLPALVLLPRWEVVVRVLSLPGVKDADLAGAVRFQSEGLHPFPEDEAQLSFSRLDARGNVLLAVTHTQTIDRYAALFAEAGVKVAGFSVSAAAIHSALRLHGRVEGTLLAWQDMPDGEVEIYGESPARPLLSSISDLPRDRALTLAAAELRAESGVTPAPLAEILPKPVVYPADHDPSSGAFAGHALPYAAALQGACPWLALQINLLPEERRQAGSRARYIPTIVLLGTMAALLVALILQPRYEDARYLRELERQIRSLEPAARRFEAADRALTSVRARTQLIDDFRRRTLYDLETIAELTRLVTPPGWISGLMMNRTTIQLAGEAEQAQELLKMLDASPFFAGSEFTTQISRGGGTNMDMFRLRAQREGGPK
jgi:hypothetical protein